MVHSRFFPNFTSSLAPFRLHCTPPNVKVACRNQGCHVISASGIRVHWPRVHVDVAFVQAPGIKHSSGGCIMVRSKRRLPEPWTYFQAFTMVSGCGRCARSSRCSIRIALWLRRVAFYETTEWAEELLTPHCIPFGLSWLCEVALACCGTTNPSLFTCGRE